MKKTERRPAVEAAQRPHLIVIPETEPYGVELDTRAVAPTVDAIDASQAPTKRERAVNVSPDTTPAPESVGRYSHVFGRRRDSGKPPRR